MLPLQISDQWQPTKLEYVAVIIQITTICLLEATPLNRIFHAVIRPVHPQDVNTIYEMWADWEPNIIRCKNIS